jgi:hypothetical protein
MLRISKPFDETIEMKELRHMYVGNISSVAGYYMVKLVAACPKVRYFLLILQLTHLAILSVWNGGLSVEAIDSLASCIRAKADLVKLHLLNSPNSRQLTSLLYFGFVSVYFYIFSLPTGN